MWGGRQSTFPTLEQGEIGEGIWPGRKHSWFLMLLHFQKLLGYGFFFSILSVSPKYKQGTVRHIEALNSKLNPGWEPKELTSEVKTFFPTSVRDIHPDGSWELLKKCRQVKYKACLIISQIIYVSAFFFLGKLSLSCLIQCLGASSHLVTHLNWCPGNQPTGEVFSKPFFKAERACDNFQEKVERKQMHNPDRTYKANKGIQSVFCIVLALRHFINLENV